MGEAVGWIVLGGIVGSAFALARRAVEHGERDRLRRMTGAVIDGRAAVASGRRRRRPPSRAWGRDDGSRLRGQLVDAAAELTAALRAGTGLHDALADVAYHAPPPLGTALIAMLERVSVGTPFPVALEHLAQDLRSDLHPRRGAAASEGVELFVTALELGRRAGPALPSLLEDVAASLRDRANTERELRVLTVQARLSATVLALLPVAFFAFVLLTSSRDVLPAMATAPGMAAVGGGLVLDALGFLWARRLSRVEA